MRKIGKGVWFGVGMTLFTAMGLYAQQTNVGNINGTVRDRTGAVIPGATVLVINQATNLRQETTTGGAGEYRINLLPIGLYTVSVTKDGFSKAERSGVPVISAQTFTVDFELAVGAVTQTVTVTGAAPVLDTTSTNMGTSRTTQELGELPVGIAGGGSREAAAYVKTMAGMYLSVGYPSGADWIQVSRGSINGIEPGMSGYKIDGVDAGAGEAETGEDFVAPTPDMVAEVRLTNNVDASMGDNGGVVVSMTLKSGTNKLHGNAYYYGLNDALSARNFLSAKVDRNRQHEPGFTIGGPVYIPHVYDGRNRTFFFTSIDVYRNTAGSTGVTTVPTALMRQGDFSELLGPQVGTDALSRPVLQGEIYDPASTRAVGSAFVRDPFTYNGQLNVIPPSQISSISQAFQTQIALPTSAGIANNWRGPNPPSPTVKDEWLLKIDENINEKHRISFASERVIPWFLGSARGTSAGLSGHSSGYGGVGWLSPAINTAFTDDRSQYRYRVNYVWTMNPSLLFNFRAGITRDPERKNISLPVGGAQFTYAGTAGLKGTLSPQTPWVAGMPGFFQGGQGAFGQRFGAGSAEISQRTPFGVDWTWSRGSHTAKFGIDYQILPFVSSNSYNVGGTFSFATTDSALPTFAGTGVSYASYLLGAVSSASVGSPVGIKTTSGGFGFFAQDKWRITSKLTLDYGLRWDVFTPLHEQYNRMSTFDPSVPNPGANGVLGAWSFYGIGPGRNGLTQTNPYYFKAFGPRLGLAYAYSPKTVFRANFGINYYPYWVNYIGASGATIPTQGFTVTSSVSASSNLAPAFNWNTGYPGVYPPLPNLNPALGLNGTGTIIDRNQNRPPMVENFGFEIGRELPGHISLRAAYVGTMAHRLALSGYNLNALPLQYLSLGSLLNANINSPQAVAAGIPKPYPTFNASVARALAQFPQMSSVADLISQYGNSTYNALQVNLQRQFGGLVFLANYTNSKILTDANNPGYYGFGSAAFQHPDLRNQEGKMLGAWDRPQIINASWVWDLPFGSGKRYLGNTKGVVNKLAAGWRLSAIQQYSSGTPISVSGSQSIPGIGGVWVNRVPGPPIQLRNCGDLVYGDPARSARLNVAAFTDPPPFTLGTYRQIPNVRTCGYLNEDVGMEKDIAIKEQTLVRIGTVWQNAFNRHIWQLGGTNIDTPSQYSLISGTSPGRTIQFFAKFEF